MSKWTNLGSFRTAKNGKKKFVLSNQIDFIVLKDGSKVSLDKFRTAICKDAVEDAQDMLSRGILDNEQLEKKLSYINDKQIKYQVTLPPATEE